METYIKDNGDMEKETGTVLLPLLVVRNTKVIGKTTKEQDMEFNNILIKVYILDNGDKIKKMEKVLYIMSMETNIRGSGNKIN